MTCQTTQLSQVSSHTDGTVSLRGLMWRRDPSTPVPYPRESRNLCCLAETEERNQSDKLKAKIMPRMMFRAWETMRKGRRLVPPASPVNGLPITVTPESERASAQSKCTPPGRFLFSPIRPHKRNVSFFIPFLVTGAGSVTRVLWDTEMFMTLDLAS